MSEVSIGSIPLPSSRRKKIGERIAREAMFRVLGRLEIGALTLHEGPDSHHFGSTENVQGPVAEVHIHNQEVYTSILTGGSIAAGESYILGHWSSPDPVQVTRLFCANMAVMDQWDSSQSWLAGIALKIAHRLNRNTATGSKDNISAHYDLGNDFFALFLDPTMMYSSAVFDDAGVDLDTASVAKLDEICHQLELTPDDHLLEIGTGWGGMAIHAAKHFGCKVTTTTISKEQYDYACAAVARENLEDRITLLCQDYRTLEGEYDKLVSIEMIEAVGHEFYKEYFQRCSDLLKPDGKMVIQAITMADQRYEQARDDVDFIKRYIFPGGCLPSVAVIAQHLAEDTNLQMVHLRDITQDYALTLDHWRTRFMGKLDTVREMGFDENFIRMWDYYLCYCEGGFRERIISTVQLAFAKPAYRLPLSKAV
ncbi:MAG: class I SAM-dependent methyltransferase [Halioglobus sp.]